MSEENRSQFSKTPADGIPSADEHGRPSLNIEDLQYLEKVRQALKTDFSGESKVRELLRQRLSAQATGSESGPGTGVFRTLWVAQRWSMQSAWMSLALIFVFLVGLTFRNLSIPEMDDRPNLTAGAVQQAAFVTGIPAKTQLPAEIQRPKPIPTPAAPIFTAAYTVSASPQPLVSPVVLPRP